MEIITLKVPKKVAKDLESKEIIHMLIDKALTKLEYYYSKCKQFEIKYGKNLENFRKELESKEENFEWWDDFIVWEGYQQAYQEWKEKYEELKNVL